MVGFPYSEAECPRIELGVRWGAGGLAPNPGLRRDQRPFIPWASRLPPSQAWADRTGLPREVQRDPQARLHLQ